MPYLIESVSPHHKSDQLDVVGAKCIVSQGLKQIGPCGILSWSGVLSLRRRGGRGARRA